MSTDNPHDQCLTTSSPADPPISAIWIGQPVKAILTRQKSFSVRGVTSRGVFLETEGGWIAFLSNEIYRGPLTLNIQNYQQIPWIEPGWKGRIENGTFTFDNLDVKIGYRSAQNWSTSGKISIDINSNEMAIRNLRVLTFVNRLIQQRESSNEYLEFALHFYNSAEFLPNSDLSPRLELITRAFLSGILPPAESAVHFLVGRGMGLTPSGDDFLSGILYALALCGQFQHDYGIAFRDFILAAIQLRSTSISANLAECASAGEVDERIFNAVDYIINGNSSEQAAAEGILSWGSSSGADTIAGFLIGLKMVELRSAAKTD
jgi:hypothetical protein